MARMPYKIGLGPDNHKIALNKRLDWGMLTFEIHVW